LDLVNQTTPIASRNARLVVYARAEKHTSVSSSETAYFWGVALGEPFQISHESVRGLPDGYSELFTAVKADVGEQRDARPVLSPDYARHRLGHRKATSDN